MRLRRFFQFRLRTFFILATLLCVALAFVALPARRQRQAVLEFNRRNPGILTYKRDFNDGPVILPDTWAQKWLGCDFGQPVAIITFEPAIVAGLTGKAYSESEWRLIEACQPEILWLNAEEQGDRDMARAARLSKLKDLTVYGPSLTDQGLLPLRQQPHLQRLAINSPLITDAGLAHLTPLSELQELDIYHSQVTAAGVAKLQQVLPQCKIGWSGAPKP